MELNFCGFTMNYCLPDVYDAVHAGAGVYPAQGGGEHCMYRGEGPGYGPHCESQPLHHPPCAEPPWHPGQHYSCSYAAGPPVFKNEFCGVDVPLGHFHPPPEFFPEIKADFSHLHWMQGAHKKGNRPPARFP